MTTIFRSFEMTPLLEVSGPTMPLSPRPRRLFRRRPAVSNCLPPVCAFMAGRPPAAGEFVEIAVVHDDGCAIWSRGVCDCSPEVKDMAEYRRERVERN